MRRLMIVIPVVLLAIVVASFVFGYKSLKSMRAELNGFDHKLDVVVEESRQQSAAADYAKQRAEEAAARAQIAAGARAQAENAKKVADSDRAQALAQAQQANQQAQQADQHAKAAEDEMIAMRRQRQEELNRMQEALSHVVETRRDPNGMTMILPDSTFRFDFDSADLNQKNRELLSRISGILLVSKAYGLSVYGYTDDVGTPDYNQQLSLRRAEAVKNYLAKCGIDPGIITVKGYGKTSPLVAGTSAAARTKNRRVEIALTDTSIKYMGEADGATPH